MGQITTAEKREYSRQYRIKNRDKINARMRKNSKSPLRRWNDYKKNAKYWGHCFKITKEEFMILWKKPCWYCGDSIESIGIDRQDNAIGYETGNLVPCCKPCNWAKNKMTPQQYIWQCKKVIERHG
jgi:hypothetical protein